MAAEILRMQNICKEYGDKEDALHNACISIKKGEVHALVGKNGSGKSTLVKIASGIIQPDSGMIFFNDNRVNIRSAGAAQRLGISVVHQLHGVVEQLDVTQNIFLGNEKTLKGGVLCRDEMYRSARIMLDRMGLDIHERTRMGKLSFAQRQIVLMIKAMSQRPRLMILDEMTSALTRYEFETIKKALDRIRSEGTSVLFVSHKIDEVLSVADGVTVLYDGATMGTYNTEQCSTDILLTAMTNGMGKKPMKSTYKKCVQDEVLLMADRVAAKYGVKGVSLTLRRGEVLGIAGIVGSGRSTLLKLLYGSEERISGNLTICGEKQDNTTGKSKTHRNIGLMPEEYLSSGLFNEMSVNFNIAIAVMERCTCGDVIDMKKANNLAEYYINKLGIKYSGSSAKVKNLSGGNKQRVMLARYMAYKPEILMLDEPMKGIDETARAEIISFINAERKEGRGVIITSESPVELIDVCDRIAVMKEGKITAEFNREQATEVAILNAMTR